MDVGLICDYIQQPVHQKYAVTGSLTGELLLAVGGVTEKVRCVMDPDFGMVGACIPWQNRRDIEPLLLNVEAEYCQEAQVPGVRIYRNEGRRDPFSIFCCQTKYDVYQILMGLGRSEVEARMVERGRQDREFAQIQSGRLPQRS